MTNTTTTATPAGAKLAAIEARRQELDRAAAPFRAALSKLTEATQGAQAEAAADVARRTEDTRRGVLAWALGRGQKPDLAATVEAEARADEARRLADLAALSADDLHQQIAPIEAQLRDLEAHRRAASRAAVRELAERHAHEYAAALRVAGEAWAKVHAASELLHRAEHSGRPDMAEHIAAGRFAFGPVYAAVRVASVAGWPELAAFKGLPHGVGATLMLTESHREPIPPGAITVPLAEARAALAEELRDAGIHL